MLRLQCGLSLMPKPGQNVKLNSKDTSSHGTAAPLSSFGQRQKILGRRKQASDDAHVCIVNPLYSILRTMVHTRYLLQVYC